jgi:hypothetical protein
MKISPSEVGRWRQEGPGPLQQLRPLAAPPRRAHAHGRRDGRHVDGGHAIGAGAKGEARRDAEMKGRGRYAMERLSF